jgi:sec-independent protein translocase protein TatA
MFGFRAWDLLIVLLIALVIFGPRKLPEIGSALGKSIREFKKAISEVVEQVQQTKEPETRQIPSRPVVSAVNTPARPEPEGKYASASLKAGHSSA